MDSVALEGQVRAAGSGQAACGPCAAASAAGPVGSAGPGYAALVSSSLDFINVFEIGYKVM